MTKRVWIAGNGKEILVEELSDVHLENAIVWCERNEPMVRRWAHERYRVPYRKAFGTQPRIVNGIVVGYPDALPLAFVYEPYSWLLHERSMRKRDARRV